MPLEEIGERFTWSEVVMLGWRSQEQSYKMKRRMDRGSEDNQEERHEMSPDEWEKFEVREAGQKRPVDRQPKTRTGRKRRKEYDGHVPEGLPDRFYDEEGEINLSKVKLKDALKYLTGMGFKFPFKQVESKK